MGKNTIKSQLASFLVIAALAPVNIGLAVVVVTLRRLTEKNRVYIAVKAAKDAGCTRPERKHWAQS